MCSCFSTMFLLNLGKSYTLIALTTEEKKINKKEEDK